MTANDWTYNGHPLDDMPLGKFHGFVYLLENPDGLKYIGRKNLWVVRKRKRRYRRGTVRLRVESDWRTYCGSSSRDLGDPGKLRRVVLRLARTRGDLQYLELQMQVEHRVLLRDDYANAYIRVRTGSSQLSAELKDEEQDNQRRQP